jgi:hypothetical protein
MTAMFTNTRARLVWERDKAWREFKRLDGIISGLDLAIEILQRNGDKEETPMLSDWSKDEHGNPTRTVGQ